jgi:CheY-like chemotaxis protein
LPPKNLIMQNEYQILVVDDDHDDHLIMFDYFKDAGIQDKVTFVDNGKKAMEYLEGIEDESKLPRLVIMDLNMPIQNGTQTLLQMKESTRFRNIPVIIFSTSENDTEKRKCLSFGALDYMVKPVTYAEGQALIKKFSSFIF